MYFILVFIGYYNQARSLCKGKRTLVKTLIMNNKKLIYTLSIGLLVLLSATGLWFYQTRTFSKTATGISYRVVKRGRGKRPQKKDYLFLKICYRTEKKQVLFDTAESGAPLTLQYDADTNSLDGVFKEAIGMIREGDTLLFKITAKELFGDYLDALAAQHNLKEDSIIYAQIKLENIMQEKEFQSWKAEEDAKAIDDYLKNEGITAEATSSGLRYIIDKPGKGKKPCPGNHVKVHYTGRLLKGAVFDTSQADIAQANGIHHPQRTYEPFKFQIGQGRVISGWDEGIQLLSQGAKARLFIPSTLAYGSRGAGFLIPPHAILVFEISLLEVN